MFSRVLSPIILAVLVFFPATLSAQVLDDLYRARVEAADRSAKTLASATRAGLEQVLVKVSGSDEILRDDQVSEELRRAQVYLQQYQYRRDHKGELQLEIRYDTQLINQLILQSGQPLWTANRPPVLIWLVVDERAGRQFGSAESTPELVAELQAAFDLRGLPLNLPLYDLQDSMSLSLHNLWEMDPLVIRNASARYEAADILVGRLTAMTSGRWLVDWVYLWEGGTANLGGYGQQIEEVASGGASLVAEQMAGRYAITASAGPATGVLLRVDGLTRYRDYRATQRFLEDIELIDRAHVTYTEGSTVVFHLRAQAEAEELGRVIGINRNLSPVDSAVVPATGPVSDLNFLWRP